MKVVHCKREKYDVYIGRDKDPERGKFGNFFTHKPGTQAEILVDSLEKAVDYFREFLLHGEDFLKFHDYFGILDRKIIDSMLIRRQKILASLHELKDKTLGCWCKIKGHEFCHGDVYMELSGKF